MATCSQAAGVADETLLDDQWTALKLHCRFAFFSGHFVMAASAGFSLGPSFSDLLC